MLTAPILVEFTLASENTSFFSGVDFTVDETMGLSGPCDFFLTKSQSMYCVEAPIRVMVQSEIHNINYGIGPCGAMMVAAQRFNQRHNRGDRTVYGCVTTGAEWKYFKLVDRDFYIDLDNYYVDNTDRIMAIFERMTTAEP